MVEGFGGGGGGGGGGWGRAAKPSSRVSRLLALCLHAELQIPEGSHRPERTLYVSVHVLRASLSCSVFTRMVGVHWRVFFFSFLIVQKFYTEGRSREEGTSPVLTGRATITLTTPVLLCSLSRSHQS